MDRYEENAKLHTERNNYVGNQIINKTESGLHFDEGKPRVDLLDPDALEGIGRVLAYGCGKYGDHNWRGGIKYSRIFGSLLRHIFALLRREEIDPESGLPHIDHVCCNAMFLSYYMKNRKDLDDRWQPNYSPGAGDTVRPVTNKAEDPARSSPDGAGKGDATGGVLRTTSDRSLRSLREAQSEYARRGVRPTGQVVGECEARAIEAGHSQAGDTYGPRLTKFGESYGPIAEDEWSGRSYGGTA